MRKNSLYRFWFLYAAVYCRLRRTGKAAAPQADAGGAKEAAKGLVDPCKLLTKAEAALVKQVKEPELKDTKNPLGQKMCLYLPVAEKCPIRK